MNPLQYARYARTVRTEFCEVLWEVDGGVEMERCLEPALKVLGDPLPDPDSLAALNDRVLTELALACETHLGIEGVAISHLRQALARVLTRWPVTSERALWRALD